MSIIVWIIFGGLAGWIASIIVGTVTQRGIVNNIVVGIIGALIGGYLMNTLGYNGSNGFNSYSLLVSIIGAVAALWTYRAATAQT